MHIANNIWNYVKSDNPEDSPVQQDNQNTFKTKIIWVSILKNILKMLQISFYLLKKLQQIDMKNYR